MVLRDAVERTGRLASRLLADDRVFSWVQRGLTFTLEARRRFDRNVSRILATVSVPSQQDLAQLEARMDALDRELDVLIERVELMLDREVREPALRDDESE